MVIKDKQEESEQAVFAAFAESANLLCTSIVSRPPPEPDILCETVDDGALAFELGEVVNPELEKAISEQREVRDQFRNAYHALSNDDRERIESCLGGPPAVQVGYKQNVLPGQWRRAVSPILSVLLTRSQATAGDRLHPGDIPVARIPKLSPLVTDVAVRAAPHGKPFFGVGQAVEVIDSTRRMLDKKFRSSYESEAPIELLLYWAAAPAPRPPYWRDSIVEYIRTGRPSSPFRRVWCFDLFERKVVVVHPSLR